jgi:hypothetical protein
MTFQNLPQELQDQIFLWLDYETLCETRAFQSRHIKKCTQFSNYRDAIQNNNILNMEWLLERGRPWSWRTFYIAAKSGNLDIMKWLKKNGCPWNSDTFYMATDFGNQQVIKWLIDNGCPQD